MPINLFLIKLPAVLALWSTIWTALSTAFVILMTGDSCGQFNPENM